MVLLAAAVNTKSGKPLVSRQFVEMSRPRIEGLLAAFPKLIGSGPKQHTFVETDSVRYVYQPMDKLYMVLITTKTSNILEDLETLRLFARVIPEYCRTMEESDIIDNAFQLIFAFDEIVAMGYRESVNLAQIRTFVEMDSHEEKVYQAVRLNQEREAKLKMKEKAKELQRMRSEAVKKGSVAGGRMNSGNTSGGFGSSQSYNTSPTIEESSPIPKSYSSQSVSKPSGPTKALKLGSKSKEWDQFADQLKQEGERVESVQKPVSGGMSKSASAPSNIQNREPVHLHCEEKVSCALEREGGLKSLEIHGLLTLRITDERFGLIRVQTENNDERNFQINQHPNIDKDLYKNTGIVGLKAPGRPFPMNADVGVLKWRLQSTDESLVPLLVTCWVSENGNGGCDVNMEYELLQDYLELSNVVITIPCIAGSTVVNDCEGEYNFDSRRCNLEWKIDVIDSSNKSGTMEFSANGHKNDFYPVSIQFQSQSLYSRIAVTGVQHVETKDMVKFSQENSFISEPEKYMIL